MTKHAACIGVALLGFLAFAVAASAKNFGPGSMLMAIEPGGPPGGGLDEGQIFEFPVQNIPSMHGFGNPANFVFFIAMPPGAIINGIGWDVTLQALPPSWLSHMAVRFSDSAVTGGFILNPGFGSNFPGIQSYGSNVVKLSTVGFPDLVLRPDNLLRLEFFELVDDDPWGSDGVWLSGLLRVQWVPTPGTTALLAVAGLFATRRRR
jgi:hypothetical protein